MEEFTARIASAIGAVLNRNWLNERLTSGDEPMITFVGSPTIVAIPPTFAAKTSAITNGIGSIPRPSNTSTVNGTMNRETVTMSRREDIPAVNNGNRTYIITG